MGALARLPSRPSDLGRIFRAAEFAEPWSPRPVAHDTLEELHTLMGVGPAMIDASPTRILFATSAAARARLAPYLPQDRRASTVAAPVCAIVGYDVDFAEQLVAFLPHSAAYSGAPEAAQRTAARNGALQGAYLIVAARALGLEAAAVSVFDADGVAAEFFRNPRIAATFLCGLGYVEAAGPI